MNEDRGKLFEATAAGPGPGEKKGPAPCAPIGPIVEQAERRWGSAAGSVRIRNPGDRSAQVIVSSAPDAGMSISLRALTFDGVTGRPVGALDPSGAATATEDTMIGIHAGRFASPWQIGRAHV